MKDKALRMALEALEEIAKDATTPFEDAWCGDLANDAITAIQETLEQPEPEPVGYLYVTDPWGAPEYHFSVEKKEGYFNEPVYKHPPKREPLTDEQEIQLIAELAMVEASGSTDGVARLGLAGAEEALEIFNAAHGIGEKK